MFVAAYSEPLSRRFAFPRNDVAVVRQLISKKGMYELVTRHGVPTPSTLFPETLAEVRAYAESAKFPVMLKGIHGNQLQARTGKKMVIASSPEELLGSYERLEDTSRPGLMIQEYIPGSDDQIYIFNGYFDEDSNCVAAFTGHKIRQYPIHVGCASLGVCRWNQAVADQTVRLMKAIGYKGVLDIGYRWDLRDGRYKVLDINPRVGQAFRLFVSKDGTDVVRALYRDLTGEQIGPIVPRDGRRWVIEDYDLESSMDYFREGTLRFLPWLRSFKGLEEGAWFSWKDPVPFIRMVFAFLKKTAKWTIKRLRRSDATSGS